jgi:hypothetical protein
MAPVHEQDTSVVVNTDARRRSVRSIMEIDESFRCKSIRSRETIDLIRSLSTETDDRSLFKVIRTNIPSVQDDRFLLYCRRDRLTRVVHYRVVRISDERVRCGRHTSFIEHSTHRTRSQRHDNVIRCVVFVGVCPTSRQ